MATAKKTTSTKKATPATEATEAVEAAVASSQESIETATKQVEKVVEMTKAQVEKTSSAAFKGYDEFTALGKDNMDAFVKSSTIAAKGFETVGKEWVSFTQSMMEANMATAKAMLGVKNVKDAVEMQSEHMRTSFDNTMAETTKLADLSMQVSNDAAKPLQEQAEKTIKKMMKPIAA